MFATRLQSLIENQAAVFLNRNPFYVEAGSGRIQATQVADFIRNIELLIEHTPIHLRLAAAAAERIGARELRDHFCLKLAEEAGHVEWAREDQRILERLYAARARHEPDPAMLAMIARIEATIYARPPAYLGYILLAESFTVLTAPTLIARLEETCGIPRAAMSALGNHVELDQAHVAEGIDEIARFIVTEDDRVEALRLVHEAMEHYDRFCRNLHAAYGTRSTLHA